MRTTSIPLESHPRTALHLALWAAQILLALLFGLDGFEKLAAPALELGAVMPWAAHAPVALVRFIGLSELLGAVGLVLPSLLRTMPRLTPIAAVGLLFIMGLATIVHLIRGEFGTVPLNLFLGVLTAFVAWGRLTARPIEAGPRLS